MEDRKEWKTGEKSDIEIRNLSVSFQDGGETVHAMEGVNAYFPVGSVTGLIGESGSGKSLLGMSILGLLSGQAKVEGTCMYKGMDLYRLIFPGLFIAISVLCLNMFGDGLRDALDPKLKD